MSADQLIDNYTGLDLTENSEIRKELMKDVNIESDIIHSKLILSDTFKNTPSYITGKMEVWYSTYIHPVRVQALNYINQKLQDVTSSEIERIDFGLLERKLDLIEKERIEQKAEVCERFDKEHIDFKNQVDAKRKNLRIVEQEYISLRSRVGREPKLLTKMYIFMLIFVGFFEVLINFEAFAKLPFMTPFIATGSTVVIGILMAYSSHLIGKFCAEFYERFHHTRNRDDISVAQREIALGMIAFFVAMGAVWYARSSFLADLLIQNSILGGTAPQAFKVIGGSMILNSVVWIVGVIISYISHEKIPGFEQSYKDKQKITDELNKMLNFRAKFLHKEFTRINNSSDIKIREVHTLYDKVRNNPQSKEMFEKLDLIKKQDAYVVSCLKQYKSNFLTKMSNEYEIILRKIAVDDEKISKEDFANMEIAMRYI